MIFNIRNNCIKTPEFNIFVIDISNRYLKYFNNLFKLLKRKYIPKIGIFIENKILNLLNCLCMKFSLIRDKKYRPWSDYICTNKKCSIESIEFKSKFLNNDDINKTVFDIRCGNPLKIPKKSPIIYIYLYKINIDGKINGDVYIVENFKKEDVKTYRNNTINKYYFTININKLRYYDNINFFI